MDAALAQALREVSVVRGLDPRRFALLAFGGAGGLHAAAVADDLGMGKVIVPVAGGVLSALGLAVSDLRVDASASYRVGLDALSADSLDAVFAALEAKAAQELPGAATTRRLDLRYRGQSFELTVEVGAVHDLARRFHVEHERRFGHADPDQPVEVVCARLEARRPTTTGAVSLDSAEHDEARGRVGQRPVRWVHGSVDADIWRGVPDGETVVGPAILEDSTCTTVVPAGWCGRLGAPGVMVLERQPS